MEYVRNFVSSSFWNMMEWTDRVLDSFSGFSLGLLVAAYVVGLVFLNYVSGIWYMFWMVFVVIPVGVRYTYYLYDVMRNGDERVHFLNDDNV